MATKSPAPTTSAASATPTAPALPRKRVDTISDVIKGAAAPRAPIGGMSLSDRLKQVGANQPDIAQVRPSVAADPMVETTPPGAAPETQANTFANLDVELLDDNPHQYRRHYNAEEIDALAQTLAHGQVEPIIVQPRGNGRFFIISGHRRVRAARTLGMRALQAVLIDSDLDAADVALKIILANEQRAETSDYERALGYQMLVKTGMAQVDLAQRLGVSKSLISSRLAMLKLPRPILDRLERCPRALSYRSAGEVAEIVTAHPELIEFIVEGIKRIDEGLWTSAVMINAAKAQISRSQLRESPHRGSEFAFVDQANHALCVLKEHKKNPRILELHIQEGIDPQRLREVVVEAMKERLNGLNGTTLSASEGE